MERRTEQNACQNSFYGVLYQGEGCVSREADSSHEKANGILLSEAVHKDPHVKYTAAVHKKFQRLLNQVSSPVAAASELEKYIKQLRAGLERTTAKLR